MTEAKTHLTRRGLDALYFSQLYRALQPRWGGLGVIFTLHHVVASERRNEHEFCPNRILEISPGFLRQTISLVRQLGLDIISLDEVRRRIVDQYTGRPFVCFTLDDGYSDNFVTAFPVFEELEVPFTVYIATGIIEHSAILWWEHLEEIVRAQAVIDIELAGRHFRAETGTVAGKYRVFADIYWHLRNLPFAEQQEAVAVLLREFGHSAAEFCASQAMSWDQIEEIAHSDLATIGAHTVNHFALSKLDNVRLEDEIVRSREIIASHTGEIPRHFAYPFGNAESAASREFEKAGQLGFDTSTTTRKGVVFPEHVDHLQALPRVSLNGDYQLDRYVKLFLSGAPFALWNRFRRMDVR